MIEINQCIGAPLEVMRRIVESKDLKHPVLWDDGCRNTRAWGVTTWPCAYLIGADGKVVWEGTPARWMRRKPKVEQMRSCIERELARAAESGMQIATTQTTQDVTCPLISCPVSSLNHPGATKENRQ